MCLAIPMKIKTVSRPTAVGEAGGLTQSIRIDFVEDVKPGDYVIVHAGFAVQNMSEDQALENMSLLEEIKNAL